MKVSSIFSLSQFFLLSVSFIQFFLLLQAHPLSSNHQRLSQYHHRQQNQYHPSRSYSINNNHRMHFSQNSPSSSLSQSQFDKKANLRTINNILPSASANMKLPSKSAAAAFEKEKDLLVALEMEAVLLKEPQNLKHQTTEKQQREQLLLKKEIHPILPNTPLVKMDPQQLLVHAFQQCRLPEFLKENDAFYDPNSGAVNFAGINKLLNKLEMQMYFRYGRQVVTAALKDLANSSNSLELDQFDLIFLIIKSYMDCLTVSTTKAFQNSQHLQTQPRI